LRTDRALAELPLADALHVEITGHQWWWEVRYDNAGPVDACSRRERAAPPGRAAGRR
jgi:cytochrome c oxidase subunit 2